MEEVSVPRRDYLVHPVLDIFLLGGLSILTYIALYLFVPMDTSSAGLVMAMNYMAIAFGFHHFLISYQFLYNDNSSLLTKDFRCFFSGILVPVAILSLYGWSILTKSIYPLQLQTHIMLFFLGHHYVKQAFGATMVTSFLKGFHYSKIERWVLLSCMLSLWMTAYFHSNGSSHDSIYKGIPYATFNIPPVLMIASYAATYLSLVAAIFLIIRKHRKTKKWPPLVSIISFLSIYVWYIPTLYHPHFYFLVAVFHVVQNMPLTYTYLINRQSALASHLPPSQRQKRVITGSLRYLFISILNGALVLYAIPKILDSVVPYDKALFGPNLFLFLAFAFVLVHHHAIDFALWRKKHKNVRKNMFLMPA